MRSRVLIAVFLFLSIAGSAAAQSHPTRLATLFEEIYGPNGLVLSSDDVQLDGTNHAAHFNSAFQSEFRLVNIALTSQLASLPLPSPGSGFTYKFDAATGTFVRSTRSFGPILAERGETIGRGRLAVNFAYQFFSFDHLDGVPITEVPAVFRHDNAELGGGRTDVVGTMNTIVASVSQFSGAVTYGVTDRLDVSLAVPVVRTRLSLLSNATIYRVGTGQSTGIHYFLDPTAIGSHGSSKQFFADESASGIGDMVVRAKTTLAREGARSLAAGIDVRLPTGDEQNLLGSGAAGVRPFAAFSGAWGVFAPHANVGYQWNGKSVLAGDVIANAKGNLPDQFVYAVGSDVSVNEHFSVIVDVLGQRVIDSPRLQTASFVASGPAGSVTLPDIHFEQNSYWTSTAAIGFKANVATKILLDFNLRFRITDAGLVDRVAPLMGVEWSF
jgi:hypothetical protein